MSDLGPNTRDLGLSTSNLGPNASDLGLSTSNLGPNTSDLGLSMSGLGLRQSPELLAAHQARRDAVDPLLAPSQPLPEPAAADVVLSCPGGVALVRNTVTDPTSFGYLFSAAHESRLAPKADGLKAFAELLDLWAAEDCFRPGPDRIATVTWPSRDTEVSRALVERGFVPQSVFAVRLAGRPVVGAADPRVTIRRAEAQDTDALARLWTEQLHWEVQFGYTSIRPATQERVAEQVAQAVGGQEKQAWVAERDGEVAGMVAVQPPSHAAWAAHTTRVAPAAYLTCGAVAAGERGGGVGTALARHVHAEMDAAGLGAMLLHYTVANPLSGPFWNRCGYRPFLTAWSRGTVG